MHFLLYQVRFPDGDEEPADIQTVDVVQVQGSHDVLAGTTARGFHSMGFLSGGHPAIRQLCSLCWMNSIDEQDRFIITGFLFQLFVSFHKRLLRLCTAFMWNANGFSVAEAIAFQPSGHPRNGIADAPPLIDYFNDGQRGWQKVIRQIFSKDDCRNRRFRASVYHCSGTP